MTHGSAWRRPSSPIPNSRSSSCDRTPTTAVALRPATQLGSQLHASVDLLYVAGGGQSAPDEPGSIGAPRYLDQPQHEWPQWADEVLDRLLSWCADCPPDVPVRAYLTQGEAADEIVRFAAEHGHDAIVLARRSHLEPGRAVTLRTILARTPCPVVLVGAPRASIEEHEHEDLRVGTTQAETGVVRAAMSERQATLHAMHSRKAWSREFGS
jgi:nucleotide-binding universal stress UspA family protein